MDKIFDRSVSLTLLIIGLFLVGYFFLFGAPSGFPVGQIVVVDEGKTIEDIANEFAGQGIIKNVSAFKIIFRLSGQDARSGGYVFLHPASVFRVAYRLALGRYGIDPVRITIHEGRTSHQMTEIFAEYLINFDQEEFIKLAEPREGYLFPDTYYFLPTMKAKEVVRRMEENFDSQIKSLAEEIAASGRPLKDIITMASLLEREAGDLETKRTIAGILWKRIEEGMPLQVDATFLYIKEIDRNTYELTLDDLEFDSPYNTYKYKGLPPGPIASPGLESVQAALDPEPSEYWYYLADHDGVTHFATTFEEHKSNKRRYLQ